MYLPFKAKIFLFLFVLIAKQSNAQNDVNFDPKNPDYTLLSSAFLKEINAHRKSLGLSSLVLDNDLYKAALDQTEYQQSIGELTHDQKFNLKATPTNRVFYYGGNHEGVGENCLYTDPYKENQSTTYTYNELAAVLFQQWKNSPPHYKNICTPDYRNTGLGFVIDPIKNRLYAVEVFSVNKFTKPFENYPNIPSGFGVKYEADHKCNILPDVDFLTTIMANYITQSNDSIFLYYRDLERFKKIITDPKDGIAIDIILREQLTCNEHHNFHGSPIHDGVMLQPIYKDDLFKKNKYVKYNEMYVFLGIIPKEFLERRIEFNTIIIKDGFLCSYSYPVDVPQGELYLLPVDPMLYFYDGKIKPGKYSEEFTFKIPFEQGEAEFNEKKLIKALEKIKDFKPFVNEVKIESFASVEGNKERNMQLQKERAKSIHDCIKPFLAANAKINYEGKINYELLKKQVLKSRLDYIKNFTDDQINEKLKQEKFLDSIKKYLPPQRVAMVTIKVNVSYDESTSLEYIHAGLNHRIKSKDAEEVKKLYSKIAKGYAAEKLDASHLCRYKVPLEKSFAPVFANYIAGWYKSDSLFTKGPKLQYFLKARQICSGDQNFMFNSILYTLQVLATEDTAIINLQEIENNLVLLAKSMKTNTNLTNLTIDFYLLAIPYYEKIRQYDKMGNALVKLKSLLLNSNIKEKDALDLALYFNSYYRFDWSMALLKKFIDGNSWKDTETFMTYFKTASLYYPGVTEAEYAALLKRAPLVDAKSFCRWINYVSPQLLRDSEKKAQYCKYCKEFEVNDKQD